MTPPRPVRSSIHTATYGHLPGLRWGLKNSLWRYLTGLSDSVVSVASGASVGSDGLLFWPLTEEPGPSDGGSPGKTRCFDGRIRLVAHRGLLHVRLEDPAIVLADTSGILTIAAAGYGAESTRLVLAEFTVRSSTGSNGRAASWTGTSVRLAAAAVGVFNGVYPAGEPLEDFTCTSATGSTTATGN